MSGLAEDSLDEPGSARQWLLRGLLLVVAIALLAGLVLLVKGLLSAPTATKRQTAKISILPDTPPPPPPPPPKEERKPEPPKESPRQAMREEPVKRAEPKPAEAPLKMEGQAGDGPSAFGAGTVSNEYKGGAPVIGAGGGGGGGNAADRAQERFYANAVRQLLHDEIERHLRSEGGELVATFSVWVQPDGSIGRFELVPTGDPARDTDLRAAFDQTAGRLHLPAPGGLPQPMRFKLSLRPV